MCLCAARHAQLLRRVVVLRLKAFGLHSRPSRAAGGGAAPSTQAELHFVAFEERRCDLHLFVCLLLLAERNVENNLLDEDRN